MRKKEEKFSEFNIAVTFPCQKRVSIEKDKFVLNFLVTLSYKILIHEGGGTYNILVAQLSKLGELLSHEKLRHPDDNQDGVPDLLTDEAALAVQILLEITDILLKLEYFILEHLQLICCKYFSCL